jgi:hypothetical protein
LLVFVFSAPSWAADPQEALSARPEASIYFAARIDDLGGALQSIFSPANIEMLTSLASPEDAQEIRLMANLASQIPAESVAFIGGAGVEGNKEIPFVQVAISVPERLQPKLDLVAQGKAKAEDVVTLLLGDAALLFAQELNGLAVKEGPEGPYYVLNETLYQSPALAARSNLLLIAFSPADLSASLAALDKAENRLAFKRRFESSNYFLTHLDAAKIAQFAEAEQEIDTELLKTFFKAPLDMEVAFDTSPEKILVSYSVNAIEALKAAERWGKITPTPGAGMFLAGGGKQLLGLSNMIVFGPEEWKIYSEFTAVWDNVLKELGKRGIAEKDIEDLLTGTVSVAVGGETTVLGKRTPGFYIALNGQKGAAAKIWNKILEDEAFSQAIPLSPLEAEGWTSLFRVDPALVPAPLLLGVWKDSFFLGVVDPQKLGEEPELTPEAAELIGKDLITWGFFDLTSTWEYLKKEVFDTSSNLGSLLTAVLRNDDILTGLVKDLFDSELAISSIKIWGADLETGFIELALADVPQEKRLLPRLVNLAASANARASDSAKASNIVSNLRSLKAAALMFYADNVEDTETELDALINLDGSATELLGQYTDNPEAYAEYIFKAALLNGEKKWIVGCDVSNESPRVKERLKGRGGAIGLIDENGSTYSGGDFVFMIAR